jgi:hypothetical protein
VPAKSVAEAIGLETLVGNQDLEILARRLAQRREGVRRLLRGVDLVEADVELAALGGLDVD